jgi:hypothetical protein
LHSSYYNAAVQVRLVYNHAQAEGEYARKVELTVFGKVCMRARSDGSTARARRAEHARLYRFFALRRAVCT